MFQTEVLFKLMFPIVTYALKITGKKFPYCLHFCALVW